MVKRRLSLLYCREFGSFQDVSTPLYFAMQAAMKHGCENTEALNKGHFCRVCKLGGNKNMTQKLSWTGHM